VQKITKFYRCIDYCYKQKYGVVLFDIGLQCVVCSTVDLNKSDRVGIFSHFSWPSWRLP